MSFFLLIPCTMIGSRRNGQMVNQLKSERRYGIHRKERKKCKRHFSEWILERSRISCTFEKTSYPEMTWRKNSEISTLSLAELDCTLFLKNVFEADNSRLLHALHCNIEQHKNDQSFTHLIQNKVILFIDEMINLCYNIRKNRK